MKERDLVYESNLVKQVEKMQDVLNAYAADMSHCTYNDYLAMERALQIMIEALIGFSRYTLEKKFELNVTKSREAIEELFRKSIFDQEQRDEINKIIGFRNVLVHDYLDIDEKVVRLLVEKRVYQIVDRYVRYLLELLNK